MLLRPFLLAAPFLMLAGGCAVAPSVPPPDMSSAAAIVAFLNSYYACDRPVRQDFPDKNRKTVLDSSNIHYVLNGSVLQQTETLADELYDSSGTLLLRRSSDLANRVDLKDLEAEPYIDPMMSHTVQLECSKESTPCFENFDGELKLEVFGGEGYEPSNDDLDLVPWWSRGSTDWRQFFGTCQPGDVETVRKALTELIRLGSANAGAATPSP